ncbi:MAG TPA: hypothetical protein VMS98_17825 [Thermoanaerobaculia bacterium]|nr:hypothetical protein [Thermoanaerobaculia bacterium]
MTNTRTIDETRLAQEIVGVLPQGVVTRLCSDDAEIIRFAVSDPSLKLKTISFSRKSLRRLAIDPALAVKIEYLQRDLVRSAARRAEFRYPRENRIVTAIRGRRTRVRAARLALGVASVV